MKADLSKPLTRNQLGLLRRIVRENKSGEGPSRLHGDGNRERTARSLVRRGLAVWHPPGTRYGLDPTEAGRQIVGAKEQHGG